MKRIASNGDAHEEEKKILKRSDVTIFGAFSCTRADPIWEMYKISTVNSFSQCDDKSNATDGTNYTEAMKVITLNYIYRFSYSYIIYFSFLRCRRRCLFFFFSISLLFCASPSLSVWLADWLCARIYLSLFLLPLRVCACCRVVYMFLFICCYFFACTCLP